MRGFNQVILIGNLGADPEMKFTPAGKAVTNFDVACSRKYTDADGKSQESTEWVPIVVWEKLAENCNKNLNKGAPVMVVGRLTTRSWEDANKIKHYKTEVIANTVNFLGQKSKDNGDPGPEEPPF